MNSERRILLPLMRTAWKYVNASLEFEQKSLFPLPLISGRRAWPLCQSESCDKCHARTHTQSWSGQGKMTVRQKAKHNRWTDWERWSDCQNHWKQMVPLIRRHRRSDGPFWQDGRARSTPADRRGWKQKDLIWKGRCGGADVGHHHDVESLTG